MNDYLDYLEHHGVKGMKRGVRKYQNADGSLTAAGKSRYGSAADAKEAYRKAKQNTSNAYSNMYGNTGIRLTATKGQRERFATDAMAYNNSLKKRQNAKYEYKIAKAQEAGKNDKVAKLRGKQELKNAKLSARTAVSNAYLKGNYSTSVGKNFVSNLVGGNKGTIAALKKAGYSDKGAKWMSYLLSDTTNINIASNKAARDAAKKVKTSWASEQD